ncbi:MAG: type II toxin-antitoxin system VapC family toxin [Planctomycetia bacterium]
MLDCSLAVAWFFEDEISRYAQAVEDSLPTAAAVVPSLWPLEVANALLMGERRKRATEAKVTAFLNLLAALPISVDDDTAGRAWQSSLHLARSHRLSVYDAAYLELAIRQRLPLATLDDNLAAAANAAGVPAYGPT